MLIKKLEDLKAWQRAMELWIAVNQVLTKSGFDRDRDLRNQLRDASDSIVSNIAEGFEQPTDRAFANYLYHSKAATAETRARLLLACERRYITKEEFDQRDALADEVARILTGLIKYLLASNRRDRGTGRQRRKPPLTPGTPPVDRAGAQEVDEAPPPTDD